jgi:DNA-binding MarR family transcriptional regulator
MVIPNKGITSQLKDKLEDEDFNLWRLLDHTVNALMRPREKELAYFNVTLEQAFIFHAILLEGGTSTYTRIAEISHRQYNSITTLINRMIKQGLVQKKKISGSKQYKISITKKGLALYEPVTINSIKMIYAGVSAKDKQLLAKTLSTLMENAHDIMGVNKKLPFLPD